MLKVIDAAQRYMRTLLDDCSAGFDGYQQLYDDDWNAADVVDPQVQAIWAALDLLDKVARAAGTVGTPTVPQAAPRQSLLAAGLIVAVRELRWRVAKDA